MIKAEYQGKVITIKTGRNKRTVEVYEGMPISDVKFLADNGIEVLEPAKPKKEKKYKGVEEPKEDKNQPEEDE